MVILYKECLENFNNDYQIERAIDAGELYRLENGIYILLKRRKKKEGRNDEKGL